MASTDARPVPQKNVAFRYYFAIRKNDGTLITTWAGQDSEVDKDGAGFSDCTNEATEIGTTGVGYIDLTSTEMNADAVNLKVTVTNTDALPVVVTFFPEEAGDYRVADTQKVDVNTIKTQTVTCGAGVTVLASVGTAATSTAQTGDSFAIVNSGTHGNAALLARTPSATSIANMNTVFENDFATNYNTTNDGWVVKLGDYAHGGTGADVTFSNFTVDDAMTYNGGISVAGTVTLSQSVTATNASNDIRGVVPTTASKTGYALASNGLASVTAWTVAITGNVTGNVSGTVGGIAGTLTTLDELDTAQDSQHTATQALIPDIYHADISLCIDEANTQDEYEARWFKNGVRVTSGITSPLIQVAKRSDGTDLIGETAMTQVGSTGAYKYDATTIERSTAGEAVLVTAKATIGGSQRLWDKWISRDSTS